MKIHSTLNRKIFDADNVMKKDVKKRLLNIARAFYEYAKIKEIDSKMKIEDVRVSGSNCSYTYHKDSDLDLHVLIKYDKNDVLLSKYFKAIKNLFNFEHEIKISGILVEVYIQEKNETHVSNGIYSVMDDKWIQKPKLLTIDMFKKLDADEIDRKYENFRDKINAIDPKEHSVSSVENLMNRIREYRSKGLLRTMDEVSIENVVFKRLRDNGDLKRLSSMKDKIIKYRIGESMRIVSYLDMIREQISNQYEKNSRKNIT